jgi:hypothetical protein
VNITKVLLAADNDRGMLEYLHEAFQTQVSVCDQCGHEEPTNTCDSASDLKDYLGQFSTPPQPIYDEAKERALFEALITKESEESGNGEPDLHIEEDGIYRQPYHHSAWHGWKACAQSRAKAVEVGHE